MRGFIAAAREYSQHVDHDGSHLFYARIEVSARRHTSTHARFQRDSLSHSQKIVSPNESN
jgi:hypothetical protein